MIYKTEVLTHLCYGDAEAGGRGKRMLGGVALSFAFRHVESTDRTCMWKYAAVS